MMRSIYCPGPGVWVPLGVYVAGIKRAKAHPDAQFPHTLCHWAPGSGRRILREFRAGIHDRINAAVPYVQRGTA